MKSIFFGILVATVSSVSQALAATSPYLPSQGLLTVNNDCSGLTLSPGDHVLLKADGSGVTLRADAQTISIPASDSPGSGSAFTVGVYGGRLAGEPMASDGPVEVNGSLVFNDFGAIGAEGGSDPLPAGFLVQSDRAIFEFDFYDTGNGIIFSGETYPVNGAGGQNFSCTLSK